MNSPKHEDLVRVVIEGDSDEARRLARQLVDDGANLLAAVELGFGRGIQEVGALWEDGEYFLPELVQGAAAMQAAMEVLQPALAPRGQAHQARGRIVLGTIEGDLHDIGKGLVGTLLSANGFEVHDLGSDVPIQAYLDRAREVDAHIVATSALLTTTMTRQKDLAEALRAAGLPRAPKLLVGGAPTSPEWATSIGATHAENAMRAVSAAEMLIHA